MVELRHGYTRAGAIAGLMEQLAALTGIGAVFVSHPDHSPIVSTGSLCPCQRIPPANPCFSRDPELIPPQAPGDRPSRLRCGHGLTHVVAPARSGGRLAGYVALGPVLLEEGERARCEQIVCPTDPQAAAFIEAVRAIPVVPGERLERTLVALAEVLASLPANDGAPPRAAAPAHGPAAAQAAGPADDPAAEQAALTPAFDHAQIGLILVDTDLRCLRANGAMARMLGYSTTELRGCPIQDISAPGEPIVTRDVPLIDDRDIGGTRIRKRYLCKDGSTFWGDLTATRLPGADGRIVGVIQDVTATVHGERIRQVQRELGAALCAPLSLDETLRRILDAALEISEMECGGIYAVDPATKAADLRCVTGLSPEFVAATTHYDADSDSARLILSGRPLYVDYARLRSSADPVRLRENLRSIAIVPVLHGGEAVACLNVASRRFQDIPTATRESLEILAGQIGAAVRRARVEEEIRSLNDQLERRVEERTAQLAAVNRELEAFAYSLSHDLRAPLRSLDGFSQTLLEDYRDGLDDTGRDYLQRVRAAAQRMNRMIDDILHLSRATRAEIMLRPVDLTATAGEIIAQYRDGSPGRVVDVVLQPGITAESDPVLIRQVLANLLENAWKFTSLRARARIEFGTLAAEEAAAAGRAGERIYFVRDNGAGFDMAHAGKLFGLFQRLHSAEEFPGTGVGLATVQRIVRRLGGDVWASAATDRGATFHFTLGRTEGEPGSA